MPFFFSAQKLLNVQFKNLLKSTMCEEAATSSCRCTTPGRPPSAFALVTFFLFMPLGVLVVLPAPWCSGILQKRLGRPGAVQFLNVHGACPGSG